MVTVPRPLPRVLAAQSHSCEVSQPAGWLHFPWPGRLLSGPHEPRMTQAVISFTSLVVYAALQAHCYCSELSWADAPTARR